MIKKHQKALSKLKIYILEDKIKDIQTKLKTIPIKRSMGWCDDMKNKKNYNKLIKTSKKIHYEKLYRKDNKYDLLIPIKYNFNKRIVGLGSCIFIHLTNNFKPTAGCIAINKDF